MSHNNTEITGEVTVELLDKDGKIKRSEKSYNSLTKAALHQVLLAGLRSSTHLADLLQTNKSIEQGQSAVILQDSPLRIFCLSAPINVKERQVYRQYLNRTQTAIKAASFSDFTHVPFISDPALNEEIQLEPKSVNSFITRSGDVKYTFEYRNTEGEGKVSAVMLGLAPGDIHTPIGIRTSPKTGNQPFRTSDLPADNYAIQHTLIGGKPHSIVFKTFEDASTMRGFDVANNVLAPGIVPTFASDARVDGGLLVPGAGDTFNLVKAFVKGTQEPQSDEWDIEGNTASAFTVTLAYIRNALGSPSPVQTDFDVVFDATSIGELQPLNVSSRKATPVLFYNMAASVEGSSGTIEIFVSLDVSVDDQTLVRVAKATIDPRSLSEGNTPTAVFETVGWLPYIIGNKTTSLDTNKYLLGYYDPTKCDYYLPIAQVLDSGSFSNIGASGEVYGLRLHKHSNQGLTPHSIKNWELFKSADIEDEDVLTGAANYGIYQFVAGPNGTEQMVVCGTKADASLQFVVHDTVWSGVNLVKPIEKDKEDTLRIIYSYQLGNQEKRGEEYINCDCQ